MSETSATITGKISSLLKCVNDINILIAYGFIRESMTNLDKDIPDDVINYCVIYAFLAINEWLPVDKYYTVDADDKNKLTVVKQHGYAGSSHVTIYADPIIDIDKAKGKYEWKVKANIGQHGSYIGITNHLNGRIDTYFYGTSGTANSDSSYCYASIGTKMDHTMGGSVDYPQDKPQRYKEGDIITVHLDLDEKSVGFSKNDEYLGIAFENINSGKYRFVISVYNACHHNFEFIQ